MSGLGTKRRISDPYVHEIQGETNPLRIRASSAAMPSWLLAISSIFCNALSISARPSWARLFTARTPRSTTYYFLAESKFGLSCIAAKWLSRASWDEYQTRRESLQHNDPTIRYNLDYQLTRHFLRNLTGFVEILFQLFIWMMFVNYLDWPS